MEHTPPRSLVAETIGTFALVFSDGGAEGDVMPDLPARLDLDRLRHQAKDLLRASQAGDTAALARVHAVSDQLVLASARLALAHQYGFASWPRLESEVERREILNSRDLARLRGLLAEDPSLASAPMERWLPRGRLRFCAEAAAGRSRGGKPAMRAHRVVTRERRGTFA